MYLEIYNLYKYWAFGQQTILNLTSTSIIITSCAGDFVPLLVILLSFVKKYLLFVYTYPYECGFRIQNEFFETGWYVVPEITK